MSFLLCIACFAAVLATDTSPRLFFTPKTVETCRARCAKGGDLEKSASGLVRVARAKIGEPLMDEPPFLKDLRGDDSTRKYKEIFLQIRPQCGWMSCCALAYLLTGDAALGAEAKRRLLHFVSFDPKGSTNTFHNDEPAMSILRRGCRAYDWTRDLYTPEERAKIEACLLLRTEDVYRLLCKNRFMEQPANSHLGRQIGFMLEACVALEKEHPEMAPWREYAVKFYKEVYPAWGKDDGGWNEGPGYWSGYMTFAYQSLTAYALAGGEDILRTKPFFHNTPWYYVYLCPPGSPVSPFGDGNQMGSSRARILRSLASLQNDPALDWFANQMLTFGPEDLETYLLPRRAANVPRPESLPGTRLFEGVGLVCSHSDLTVPTNDVAFYFRASPYGSVSHGHNDQNCFVLTGYGEPLAIPTGYYNYYNSPHHDRWTRSTRAKCGITYDDVTSQIRGPAAASKIRDFKVDGDCVSFSGDATAAYGGVLTKAVREVRREGRDRFVIRDILESPQPHRFRYWLHAFDKMDVDSVSRTVTIKRPNASLEVRFRAPEGLSFEQTEGYDPAPEHFMRQPVRPVWHLCAVTPPTNRVTIVSELIVRPARSPQAPR